MWESPVVICFFYFIAIVMFLAVLSVCRRLRGRSDYWKRFDENFKTPDLDEVRRG